MQIKNRYTDAVIFEDDKPTLRETVLNAVAQKAYLAGADLAGADLAGANLAGADLADADLAGADLADADLAGANLARADLARADLADADLAGANLAGADLAGANLAGADLAGANLARADLADADLADAGLADADLAGADLARAYLAGADNVSTEVTGEPRKPYVKLSKDPVERLAQILERNPGIPIVEDLDGKILAAIENGGGLEMSNWHTCETTHCMAGWAIHLAGDAGKALEAERGPQRAGALIYRVSTGRAPHFFASNQRALADLKERVRLQQPA